MSTLFLFFFFLFFSFLFLSFLFLSFPFFSFLFFSCLFFSFLFLPFLFFSFLFVSFLFFSLLFSSFLFFPFLFFSFLSYPVLFHPILSIILYHMICLPLYRSICLYVLLILKLLDKLGRRNSQGLDLAWLALLGDSCAGLTQCIDRVFRTKNDSEQFNYGKLLIYPSNLCGRASAAARRNSSRRPWTRCLHPRKRDQNVEIRRRDENDSSEPNLHVLLDSAD